MERVLKNQKLAEAELATGLPEKKRPMIIVYDENHETGLTIGMAESGRKR